MSMDTVSFEDLDLFKLLRLDHLSDEEKVTWGQELVESALNQVGVEILPQFLTEEEMAKFTEFSGKPESQPEAMQLLEEKIPDFQGLLKEKLLAIKKDMVKANVEERVEINKKVREKLRELKDDPDLAGKILKNEQERTDLEKTLVAIDSDNWATASSLIFQAQQ